MLFGHLLMQVLILLELGVLFGQGSKAMKTRLRADKLKIVCRSLL